MRFASCEASYNLDRAPSQAYSRSCPSRGPSCTIATNVLDIRSAPPSYHLPPVRIAPEELDSTVPPFSANVLDCSRFFLGSYLALSRLLPGSFSALTWLLLGSYLALTRLLSGSYLTIAIFTENYEIRGQVRRHFGFSFLHSRSPSGVRDHAECPCPSSFLIQPRTFRMETESRFPILLRFCEAEREVERCFTINPSISFLEADPLTQR